MIRLILIVIVFSSSSSVIGQTYLGKKWTFTVGNQISPSINLLFDDGLKSSYNKSSYERTIFPLKFDIDSRYMLNSKLSIGLNLSLHGLKNSEYAITSTGEADDYWYHLIDKYKLYTNARSIGCDLLIFPEYGPIGNHFTLGAGYTSTVTSVYSTLNHNIGYMDDIVYNLEEWKLNSNFLSINIGYGTTVLISNHFLIEFGVKSTIFFGLDQKTASNYPISQIVDPVNYQLQTKDFTRQVTLKNLRSTNIILFYVKFGLGI